MKLYRKADGEIVGTQALAGKGHTAIDVPVDKQGLIAWLNEHLPSQNILGPFARQILADEGSDDHIPVLKSTYNSPLDARSTIAGIDAGMCSSAIHQMDGVNLAKVVGAAIERMADLSAGLAHDEDLLS